MKISVRLRTGDWAIIVGAAAIAAYEKAVLDDEDLISRRAAAYKRHAPTLTTTVILMTALHLLEWLPIELDVYHWLVRWARRSTSPPPQPHRQ